MAKHIRVLKEFSVWLVPKSVERHFPVGHEGYEIEKVVEEGQRLGAIEVIGDGREVRKPHQEAGNVQAASFSDQDPVS